MRKIPMILAVAAVVLTAQPGWAEEAGARAGGRGGHGPGQMFQNLDKDGNGSISKAEFLAGAEARFAKMDKNSDGELTKDEMPTRPEGRRGGGPRGPRGGSEAAPPADAPPPEAPPAE